MIEKRKALELVVRPLYEFHDTSLYPPMTLPLSSCMIVTEAPRLSQLVWKVEELREWRRVL